MKVFRNEFYIMSQFKEIYYGGWFIEQNLLTFNENIFFKVKIFKYFLMLHKFPLILESKALYLYVFIV